MNTTVESITRRVDGSYYLQFTNREIKKTVVCASNEAIAIDFDMVDLPVAISLSKVDIDVLVLLMLMGQWYKLDLTPLFSTYEGSLLA